MVNQVKSQTNYIVVGKKYSVVKLTLNNYQFKKAKNLSLINDSIINYENYETGVHEVVSVKNVKFLSEKKGTFALVYGLVGAGIGLSSVLITHATYNTTNVDVAPVYIGMTVGCAAIGTLIGACIPKWKKLEFQDNRTTYTFRILPNINKNYYRLGLTVNF